VTPYSAGAPERTDDGIEKKTAAGNEGRIKLPFIKVETGTRGAAAITNVLFGGAGVSAQATQTPTPSSSKAMPMRPHMRALIGK
jgi:hypothetical protein